MANNSRSAGIRSVEEAEKIIQSYAYGKDLDQAILYLKKNDPENTVLANIKDFESDRPMLKVLNALYRADEARKNNDTAELQKIAEFLNTYKEYKNRGDMTAILKDFPELKAEEVAAIKEIAAETEKVNHIREKQNIVREKTPSMSDDDIVANSEKIQGILSKWSDAITEKDNVTVVDYNGEVLDDKKAKEIRGLHRQWVELDITSMHSDNAAFAAMSDAEKEEVLKKDIYDRFWSDIEAMAAATAKAKGAKDEEVDKVRADARRHKPVTISTLAYDANREELKEDIADKVNGFDKQKKEKAKGWFSRQFEKLNNLSRKVTGYTPVEFGKMVVNVFSSRRFATNVAATWGSLGLSGLGATSAAAIAGSAGLMAAAPAIAVAATGIAAYGLYSAYSQQRWSVWEKKHAYWKAAKEKGDAKEIARWTGMAGWNNALKAIKSNPEENKVYEEIKKNNKRYGLLSGLLMGVGTAFVPGGAVVGRALGAGARGVGANMNAKFMYDLAKQKYAENPTEQNETNMKRARMGLIFGIGGTALMEAGVAYSASHPIGVEYNPDNVVSNANNNDLGIAPSNTDENGLPVTPWGKLAQGPDNSNDIASDVTPDAPTVDWHDGITAHQAQYVTDHVQGKAAMYAKLFGWDVNPENTEEVVNKMAGNIQSAIDNGALPNKPVGEVLYKYLHLIAWREAAEPVSTIVGGKSVSLLQTTMVDGEPTYYTNAAEIRALNHIIFCAEKPEVSADAIGHTLDRITPSGDDLDKSLNHLTNNRYVGTADLMHNDGDAACAHVSYWERFKGAVKHIFKQEEKHVVEEQHVEQQETAPLPQEDKQVNNTGIGTVLQKDHDADTGVIVLTKDQLGRTTTFGSSYGVDSSSIKNSMDNGTHIISGSAVNIGPEVGSPAWIAAQKAANVKNP